MKLLITTTLNRNLTEAKFKPLIEMPEVDEIICVSNIEGPSLPKVRYVYLNRHLYYLFGRIPTARAILKLFILLSIAAFKRPDVVMGYAVIPHSINAFLVGKLFRIPVVANVLGLPPGERLCNISDWNVLARSSIREMLRRCDLITVTGSRSKAFLIKKGIAPEKIFILPSAIDTNRFYPANASKSFDLITVGRLVRSKRIDLFLRIVSELKKYKPDIKAVILGEGPLKEDLLGLSQLLGLKENIEFLGHRDNVEFYLNRSKVFVLTSAHEGLTLSVLEALACGVVVVATNVGDLSDILKDRINSIIIKDFTEDSFIQEILDLLNEATKFSAYSQNALNSIIERYTVKEASENWRLILKSLNYRYIGVEGKSFNILVKGFIYKALKEGPCFKRLLSFLEETQWYSPEELKCLQEERLKELIKKAIKRTPYYQEIFNREGLGLEEIISIEDLKKMPILGKKEVRGKEKQFIPKRHSWPLRKTYTSGTTGTPLKLYRDLFSINFENAFLWRQKRWAGINFGDRKITLRGAMVAPADKKNPPFWRYNPIQNELTMSSYHISRRNLKFYLETIKRFSPVFIEAYPSAIFILSSLMKEENSPKIPVKAVFTSSETLSDIQRHFIEEEFECKVFDLYGNAERVLMIGNCEEGNYHVFPEYGICEFLPYRNNTWELIGTGLINFSMPLLRYNTEDLALPFEGRCSCGRAFPLVKEILGRRDDILITPDGNFIGRLDHIFKGLEGIVEAQIIQEELDRILLKVVPADDFTMEIEQALFKNLRERVGNSIKIDLKLVPLIERLDNGKFCSVVSRVRW